MHGSDGLDSEIDRILSTSRCNAKQEIKNLVNESRYSVLENHSIPLFALDNEHRVILWNKPMEELTGVSSRDVLHLDGYEHSFHLRGERKPVLLDFLIEGEQIPKETYRSSKNWGDSVSAETTIFHPDSKIGKAHMVNATLLRDPANSSIINGGFETIHDISAYKNSYMVDPVTGVKNIAYLNEWLSNSINGGDVDDSYLCYINLKGHDVIEKKEGLKESTRWLRGIANLISRYSPEKAELSRMTSDNFALMLNLGEEAEDFQIIDQVCNSLFNTINGFSQAFDPTMSTSPCGIGVIKITPERTIDDFLQSAYDASTISLEEEKPYVIFKENNSVFKDKQEERVHNQKVHRKINESLANKQILLYAQPIVDICTPEEAYNNFEMLLRMQNNGEMILPGEIFRYASENYELLKKIDFMVIDEAMKEYNRAKSNKNNLNMSINLTGMTIQSPNVVEYITNRLEQYNVPAENICFELTEDNAIKNMELATKLMYDLKEKGCKFAMDDFGKGMSSLSYLRKLPIDYLKIDKSFVINQETSYVETINTLGKKLNLGVIAEGVEDKWMLNKLKESNVDYAQGFFLGKPGPLADYVKRT